MVVCSQDVGCLGVQASQTRIAKRRACCILLCMCRVQRRRLGPIRGVATAGTSRCRIADSLNSVRDRKYSQEIWDSKLILRYMEKENVIRDSRAY